MKKDEAIVVVRIKINEFEKFIDVLDENMDFWEVHGLEKVSK